MSILRISVWAALGAALVATLVWALWPQPMQVDLAPVTRGPMQGAIMAQGVTRVRNPYAITAPITGATTRAPVEVGDRVIAGETVVAVIQPSDPALMDARARAQADAAVAEAQAGVSVAETNLARAESALEHATRQLERNRTLADRGIIPLRILEDIETAHRDARQMVDSALSQLDLNRAALARAQAQLLGPPGLFNPDAEPGACCVQIVAPHDGIVLKVDDQNARFVQAGSPLLTIGDLTEMEVELDLLSSDAVQVPPDAMAEIARWGGDGVLAARLRRIDPAAFTRVSALGIEEQRVRLRLDLLTPPADRAGLGEGFRVHVRLIIWDEPALLRVPQAALFRQGDGWAVFVADAGRARLRPVEIGRQAGGQAEVLSGLEEGVQVVLYPATALTPGATITARD
jgi:HlyD family secretion protein